MAEWMTPIQRELLRYYGMLTGETPRVAPVNFPCYVPNQFLPD